MATLTAQTELAAGTALSLVAAAAGGDQFVNTGQESLIVKNGSGSSITVTIAAQRKCNRGSTHNGGGTVAAGAETVFGKFPTDIFNDANNYVQVTYSAVTTVTVTVVRNNEDGI